MDLYNINDEKVDFGPRKTGMTVPDGFFDEFQAKLEAEIDHRESRHLWLKRISIAASVCLLVGVGIACMNLFGSDEASQQAVQMAELQQKEEAEMTQQNADQVEDLMLSSFTDAEIYDLICYSDF